MDEKGYLNKKYATREKEFIIYFLAHDMKVAEEKGVMNFENECLEEGIYMNNSPTGKHIYYYHNGKRESN